MREVVISENSNLEFIEENAFALCSDLQSIATLSKRVAYVGPNAFAGFDILTVYCQAQSKPESWDTEWDNSVLIVIWNHNP